MYRAVFCFLLSLFFAGDSVAQNFQELVVLSADNQSIYRVNPQAGTTELVGAISAGTDLYELVDLKDGRLATFDRASEQIIVIDENDAAVLSTVQVDQPMWISSRGMAVDAAGVLYLVLNGFELRTVDLATGQTTLVSTLTGAARVEAIAFTGGDFDFLIAVGSEEDDSQSENLYIVNRVNGQMFLRGATGVSDIDTLTLAADGQLYGTDSVAGVEADVYELCPVNGIATLVSNSGVTGANGIVGGAAELSVDDFALVRGIEIGGSVDDISNSNDEYLQYRPGFTLGVTEPPVWLVFLRQLGPINPESLEITFESSANSPGLTQNLEISNWTTQSFDILDVRPSSFNVDVVISIELSSGLDNYIRDDGQVRAKAAWRKTGFTIVFPWVVSIDQFVFGVE